MAYRMLIGRQAITEDILVTRLPRSASHACATSCTTTWLDGLWDHPAGDAIAANLTVSSRNTTAAGPSRRSIILKPLPRLLDCENHSDIGGLLCASSRRGGSSHVFGSASAGLRPASPARPTNRDRLQGSSPAYRPIRGLKYAVLERLANFLSPLRLPADRKLVLLFDECGAEAKPYKGDGIVVICYELQKKIEEIAVKVPKKETQEAVQRIATTMPFNDQQRDFVVRLGTLIQVALNGVTTAVFDILKVPVWGQSEDAADRLAAFLMVQFSEEVAVLTISGTAMFFELSEKTYPDARRYYNYLCIAFGGRPQTFQFLVAKGILPQARAQSCVYKEYEQVRKAFNLRIMPYVDADRLVQVRSMQSLVAGLAN